MKKRISIILAMLICLSLVPTMVFAAPAQIAKIGETLYTDLHDALAACKSGETVELLGNVDLAGVTWTPVAFKGTFDGKNHTISNLTVSGAGLFASVNVKVMNLTIDGASITASSDNAAVVAGTAFGIIDNVTVKNSTVTTTGEYAGAIVGNNSASIKNCTVTNCEITGDEQVGGVDGYHWCGGMENCVVTETIVTANTDRAGGLIGKLQFARANNGANIGTTQKADLMYVNSNSFSGTVNGGTLGGGIAGQIMGDYNAAYGDVYEVKNNTVTATLNGTTTNPIGNLRSDQPVSFCNALPTSVTGNTFNGVEQEYSAAGEATALTFVARIDTIKYKTLADALKAAESGDTIEVLAGTWGAEAIGTLTTSEANSVRYKSLTIRPATGAAVKFTSDVDLGYDDSSTVNATMTVKGFAFENASLTLGNYVKATVENCSFSGTGSAAGALVIMDSCCTNHKTAETYPASQATVKNCTIDGTATGNPGIRIRNSGNVTLIGNTVENAKHNGILFEANASIDNNPIKTVSITGNTITEWNASNVADGGRAMRLALGNLAAGSTVTITGNTMTKATLGLDAPDFVKITGATNAAVSLENNYWNNKSSSEVNGNTEYYTCDTVPATAVYTTVTADVQNETIKIGGDDVRVEGTSLDSQNVAEIVTAINAVMNSDSVAQAENSIATATDADWIESLLASGTDINDVEIEGSVEIELKNVVVASDTDIVITKMTFDVTPMITIRSGSEVIDTVAVPNSALNGPITFRLPVQKEIEDSYAAVYHEGEFLNNYEIKTDAATGEKYVEVSDDEFSLYGYIILNTANTGAKIGSVPYATLGDAIAKADNGDTITLMKNAGEVTVSRATSFTVDTNGYTATIVAGDGYQMTQEGNTYTFESERGDLASWLAYILIILWIIRKVLKNLFI